MLTSSLQNSCSEQPFEKLTGTSLRVHTHISLLIGTNGEPLAATGKFPSAIGKLMIGKTLATNGEEITNAMIGNDVLANYW